MLAGVVLAEHTQVLLSMNDSPFNLVGILIEGASQPTLENDRCRFHRKSGFFIREQAGAHRAVYVCIANIEDGITVFEHAHPVLEAYQLIGNDRAGWAFSKQAQGTAQRKVIRGNAIGLMLENHSHPTRDHNQVMENKQVGIRIMDRARGEVRHNEIQHNVAHGIVIQGIAEPVLEDNHCVVESWGQHSVQRSVKWNGPS
ncbi:MAG: hypothetical protein KatS3mg114_0413 [Planctomycetaceae bacterium]|nr:MAG: hypothetical protein KatS3mg114_0413 [Planctomycetaceae bacterium]